MQMQRNQKRITFFKNIFKHVSINVILIIWVLYRNPAVSETLDESDFTDIFCWESKRGYIKEFPEIPPARSHSSCFSNISRFGIRSGNYYKLSIATRGYVSVQLNLMADGITTTDDDYSYMTLVRNKKYSNNNEPQDRDAFYFAPTQDCEWYTLHNRYTDLYNGYATVLDGVFDNETYTMLIMKHHLNASTEKEWITPRYLWKPVAVEGKKKKFRLISKAFPGDFVTWTFLEYHKGEYEHFLEIERSNDSEDRPKYDIGNEWWLESLFYVDKISFDKLLLPRFMCTNDCSFISDKTGQSAAAETNLISFSLYFISLILLVYKNI